MRTLTDIIIDDSERIPNFIDMDTIEGTKSMGALHQIFMWIGNLNQEKFLSEYEIDRTKGFIETYLDRIHRAGGTKVYIKSRDWVRFRMSTYMKFSRENELYEQLSNIQKTFNLIFP